MFIIDIFGHKAIFRAQSKGLQAGQPDIIVISQQAGQINIIAFSATNRTNPEGERGISTYPCCPFLIPFPHTLSSYPFPIPLLDPSQYPFPIPLPYTPSLYYSIEFQRREWQLVYYQLFLDFKLVAINRLKSAFVSVSRVYDTRNVLILGGARSGALNVGL